MWREIKSKLQTEYVFVSVRTNLYLLGSALAATRRFVTQLYSHTEDLRQDIVASTPGRNWYKSQL